MNIGWLGLGRLGLPCALTLATKGGHSVFGYDPKLKSLDSVRAPYPEPGVDEMIADGPDLKVFDSVEDVVAASDVIFLAVQTPHAPAYDGSQDAPGERRDFDYTALTQACRDVCRAANSSGKDVTLVVISTVLPGTMNRCIRPLLGKHVKLAYNPFFIAMSTTVSDYLHPEFVLIGADEEETGKRVESVYRSLHDRPAHHCSIPSAELTKVSYNTFISAKIAFANSLMEICHHTGADVDEVVDGLQLATDRVVSPRYMRAGMGDGGACHPRDLIAMSWLAQRLGLSYDLFESLARGREAQSRWLARFAIEQAEVFRLRTVFVLGKSYKPGTPLTNGSPALLLKQHLRDDARRANVNVFSGDPHVDGVAVQWSEAAVFVVATMHPEFADFEFPLGSVVIDPFRYIPEQPGVTLVPLGKRSA